MDPPVPAASERDDLMREVADLRRQLAKHELDEVSLSETNAALRKSEAQFGRIFQQSPICLTISDIESGELFRVNDIWCETFGYTPEEAIGKTTVVLDLLGPVDSNREAFWDVLKKDGKVRNVEARMQTKDRQILTVLYSCDTIDTNARPSSTPRSRTLPRGPIRNNYLRLPSRTIPSS